MEKLLELPREELIRIGRNFNIIGRTRMSNHQLAEAIFRLSRDSGVSSFFIHRSEGEHLRVEFNNIYLPNEIGSTRACILYRDPLWVFTYWEVTRDQLPEGDNYQFTLHVVNATTHAVHATVDDVERIGRWYLCLNAPETEFYVSIGVTFANGEFREFVRSNTIKMPAISVAEESAVAKFLNRDTGAIVEYNVAESELLREEWEQQIIVEELDSSLRIHLPGSSGKYHDLRNSSSGGY